MKPLFWLIVFSFLLVRVTQADIYLNEISAGSSPEYVELYNSDLTSVELNNWFIDDIPDKGSSPKAFSLTLAGQGFGVIELNSMLNNSGGDSVRLLNENQTEIDRYDYTNSISLNDIFLRCPNGGDSWVLTTLFSKAQSNEANCLALTPTLVLEETPIVTTTPIISTVLLPSPTVHATPGVILNEIMVYPEDDGEWVELYNPETVTVTLEDWYLDDLKDAGSLPKAFSIILEPKSFGVINLNSSVFNNSGDQVRLLDSKETEIDKFEYDKTTKNHSFSRQNLTKNNSWCLTDSTPNQHNHPCLHEATSSINPTITQALTQSILSPTTVKNNLSLILPKNLKLSQNYYQLKTPKVLGKATINQDSHQAELVFWLQFTKINLWLNLLLNSFALICLNLSLPAFYRSFSG